MQSSAENFARRIVARLQQAGHVAYFAGGCVRDRVMGRPPKDYDVATSARPEQVLALYPRGQKVGVAFGVVLLVERAATAGERLQVEVATFRADGTYSDGRHPDSVRFTTAQEDAQRRDFTCNGLFYDPITDQTHDFVGGLEDIAARRLRAIGDPEARFREDHLRMLRAVRFAARLGFSIDAGTFAAMQRHAQKIRGISRERIHDELARILPHQARADAARMLDDAGLLQHLWPAELLPPAPAPVQWRALRCLPESADFVMALAAMHVDLAHRQGNAGAVGTGGNAVAQLLRRELLLNNEETADLAWLLDQRGVVEKWEALTKAPLKRLLADSRWPRLEGLYLTFAPPEETLAAFRARIEALRAEGVAPVPLVTGEGLIRLGAAPGPTFKRWLEVLYDRQLEGELQDRSSAEAAAQALIRGQ